MNIFIITLNMITVRQYDILQTTKDGTFCASTVNIKMYVYCICYVLRFIRFISH